MTGIFKSHRQINSDLMNHLGLGHIILLFGVGLLLGPAAAELTAYQNLMPSAEVGQMVTVTVSLTYNGQNSTEAVVAPNLPPGVVANAGGQSAQLFPGVMQQISYSLTAQQSGTYWIVSDISYAEDGTWRNLRLEAPFTAIGSVDPQPLPRGTAPGAGLNSTNSIGSDPFTIPLKRVICSREQHRMVRQPMQPDNNGTSGGVVQDGMQQDGFNHCA